MAEYFRPPEQAWNKQTPQTQRISNFKDIFRQIC